MNKRIKIIGIIFLSIIGVALVLYTKIVLLSEDNYFNIVASYQAGSLHIEDSDDALTNKVKPSFDNHILFSVIPTTESQGCNYKLTHDGKTKLEGNFDDNKSPVFLTSGEYVIRICDKETSIRIQ